jgi:hypothetical protein
MNEIRDHLEQKGIDTVFCVVSAKEETYLLTDWEDLTNQKVANWIKDLKKGVPTATGKHGPFCTFNLDISRGLIPCLKIASPFISGKAWRLTLNMKRQVLKYSKELWAGSSTILPPLAEP